MRSLAILGLLILLCSPAWAADPEIDQLLRSPVGKDWITNGGNLTNQRYSTLKQIDTTNVKQLKGAWMTRLKGSGAAGKYSFEASPLVKNGIMYVITGNDDVITACNTIGISSTASGRWRNGKRSQPHAGTCSGIVNRTTNSASAGINIEK